jgi:hypothetical protein
VARGRGRGGVRRWREWLRRATQHRAADDHELVQAAEQSRREDVDEPAGSSGPSRSSVSSGYGGYSGTKSQASLDQVLRRAAEARAARCDQES